MREDAGTYKTQAVAANTGEASEKTKRQDERKIVPESFQHQAFRTHIQSSTLLCQSLSPYSCPDHAPKFFCACHIFSTSPCLNLSCPPDVRLYGMSFFETLS